MEIDELLHVLTERDAHLKAEREQSQRELKNDLERSFKQSYQRLETKFEQSHRQLEAMISAVKKDLTTSLESLEQDVSTVKEEIDRMERRFKAVATSPMATFSRPRAYYTATEMHSCTDPVRKRMGHFG
jgi:methyl-accepting chemotaxis protein